VKQRFLAASSRAGIRTEGRIAKVRKRIQEERCVTVRMMADEFGVNRGTIRQILVEDLGKRKVASRFVPHALSDDQRHERVQYAKDIIKTARRNKNFLNSIVAEDETQCFRYDPTTKRQSAEWKSHLHFVLLRNPQATHKNVEGHRMLTPNLHLMSLGSCEFVQTA
jgi:hypothetical protein